MTCPLNQDKNLNRERGSVVVQDLHYFQATAYP